MRLRVRVLKLNVAKCNWTFAYVFLNEKKPVQRLPVSVNNRHQPGTCVEAGTNIDERHLISNVLCSLPLRLVIKQKQQKEQ